VDWSRFKKVVVPYAYHHGITKKEMLEVFEHETIHIKAKRRGELRYNIYGTTNSGKVLLIVAVPQGKSLKIINAYYPVSKRRKAYLKRRRKR